MSFLSQHLVSLLIFLPVAGAVLVALTRRGSESLQKTLGLAVSGATFALSLLLVTGFRDVATMQFAERRPWIPAWGISYHVGVDGLSLWLVILTTFLTPLCLLGSWSSIEKRVREFVVFMLLLEAGMVGVFVAQDLFLFYVFWEAMLIPMYLLIGIWGHERRIYAAVKFFLYTFAGSVLMLVAFLVLYRKAGLGSFDIPALVAAPVGPGVPDLALPGLRPRLRDQGADVAVPHLAPRRARRGADRGLGPPGRGPSEDGGLRLPAARDPALPRRGDAVRAAGGRPRRDRHRLRRARLAGAARPEEARGLLVGVPPRLRDAGHRRLHHDRCRGRGLPDAEPRRLHGGALLPRGDALRPAPHAAHLRVRGAEGGHALVLRGLPADQPLLDRGAGLQRVRRRVPDPGRLLAVPAVDGGRLLAGRDPGRGLRALDGQAGLLRRGHEPEEPGPAGPLGPRGDGARAARRARDRHGDREPGLHATHRAVGGRARAPGERADAPGASPDRGGRAECGHRRTAPAPEVR